MREASTYRGSKRNAVREMLASELMQCAADLINEKVEDKCVPVRMLSEAAEALRDSLSSPCVPEGFILAPLKATSIMAMRGSQATNIFDEYDYAGDYFDLSEAPGAPTHKFDDDERPWRLAAAIYNAAIRGLIEWTKREAAEGSSPFIESWKHPQEIAPTPRETVAGETVLVISQEGYQKFLDVLDNPPPPNEALRKLMKSDPNERRGARHWPDPTPEMLDDPVFNKIWEVIKTWDVNVPSAYGGYCGATGNHVRAIYDALSHPAQPTTKE